jgi:hypothetical protein
VLESFGYRPGRHRNLSARQKSGAPQSEYRLLASMQGVLIVRQAPPGSLVLLFRGDARHDRSDDAGRHFECLLAIGDAMSPRNPVKIGIRRPPASSCCLRLS